MKTAAKVFIWIGMIFTFWLIFPVIVGIFALKALENAKTKDDLMLMGILTLLFCNLIAGILMLVMSEEDLQKA